MSVFRDSKQCLTFQQRHVALLIGEMNVNSGSRIEFNGRSVREQDVRCSPTRR